MADRWIDKWLGRSPAVSAEVAAALEDLARLDREQPALKQHVELFRDLLPRLFAEPPGQPSLHLTHEQAAAKLAGGVPLLRGETIPLDRRTLDNRWFEVCAALSRQRGDPEVQALAEAVRQGRLHLIELAQEVSAGPPQRIRDRADAARLDPGLMRTILRLTLLPDLSAVNAALTPLRSGTVWEHGYCPTCGSWPLLGEYRGLEQLRYLRCGLCAAEWEFPRLQCVFCGCRDHHLLGNLHVEGEEVRRRVAICEACRGYVHTIATLSALTAPGLLVAELALLPLDLMAAKRGYAAPPV